MRISNKDRFPEAEWLEQPEPIGTVGQDTLVKLGKEYKQEDDRYMLVARGTRQPFFAIPIYELQGHSQDAIVITEEQ